MAIGATTTVPLVYDFYGFPQRYYDLEYRAPGAPELAATVKALMPANEPVLDRPTRGLDHGAWVPLMAMYPDADIPVLQMSMPDLDPAHLFEVGRRLAPLRDEGVLIVGSGFMTHGLPFIGEYWDGRPGAPQWSVEFDRWAAEALERGDIDSLFAFREKAPGHAVRTPDGRALRAAVRHARRRREAGRRAEDGHRRVLPRAVEAVVRGAVARPDA